MNYRKFVLTFLGMVLLITVGVGGSVAYLDPLFHYHKPRSEFYYPLKQQRYQNDGILRHFNYDAIITGTSMTENFKSTEFDSLFDVNSIKVSYSGGSFKEINDAIKVAYKNGHQIKAVVRSLDTYKLNDSKDAMRTDLGSYPTYLYNDVLYDDVKYLLNIDVFRKHCLPIIKNKLKGREPGITSFDEYSNWNKDYKFGKQSVLKKDIVFDMNKEQFRMLDSDYNLVKENIEHNVTNLAKKHPETTFYYFFPPYSVIYWGELITKGEYLKYIESEKLAIELILECPNIKLFSFNLRTEITTDLNNYKDLTHYGEWINSDILRYMKEEKGLLTKENYQEYLIKERELYMNYPYDRI